MSEARKPKTAPRVVHAAVEFVSAPAVPKRHRTRWILGDPDADAVEQEVEEHVRGRRGKDAKPTAERKAKDVERFELLAKATAKVPTVAPRKLYVDKRDGSIGVITARDLGDKLLEREAIANETAEGVRPKVVLCEVCKCAVEVGLKGAIPRKCKRHHQYVRCPRGCGRAAGKHSKSCNACLTKEERAAPTRAAFARMTPEERKANAEKKAKAQKSRLAAMSEEERARYGASISQLHTARHSRMSDEERACLSRKLADWHAGMSPAEREERAKKLAASTTRSSKNFTEEERAVISKKQSAAQKERFARMPEEQKRAMADKRLATRRAKATAKKAGEQ